MKSLMPLEIKELFFCSIPFSVRFRWKNREMEKKRNYRFISEFFMDCVKDQGSNSIYKSHKKMFIFLSMGFLMNHFG